MSKTTRRPARSLTLPSWLKLRMNDELKNQVEWMIERAGKCNAGSMNLSATSKGRPWKVTLQVKRIYDKKH